MYYKSKSLHNIVYKCIRTGVDDLALIQNQSCKDLTQEMLQDSLSSSILVWKSK